MLTLCQKYSNLEWSGYCLHEKKEGLFNEYIIIHGVYLMDVGTATATDFKGNADVASLIVAYPELDELIFDKKYRILQCKVHSHQNLNVFYSGTDQQDLEDNAKGKDLYVSIVVNNKMEFFAKACRWAKTEKFTKTVEVLKNGKYEPYTYEVNAGQEKIVQECKVKIDIQNPNWFTKRLTEVKPAPVAPATYNYNVGWKGVQTNQFKAPVWESEPVQAELFDEYPFEDEIAFLFGLPKKVEPEEYLKTQKVDMNVFMENISSYDRKAEDSFFEQLAEWIIFNDLQESPFYNQIAKYLSHVEA